MKFPYMTDFFPASVVGALGGMFPSAALGIASYVLSSLALYTLAQRRGLRNPWLAWIPVIKVWLLGSLSDQYRYVARGQNCSKRKSLLVLSILSGLAGAAICVMAAVMVVNLVIGMMGGVSEAFLFNRIDGQLFGIIGLVAPLAAVAIARAVIYYMALSDVYKSMDPANCTVFLVLSILFGVTEPFFLFFSRNKDLGMPPRRETVYTSQEAWENQ